MPMAEDLPPSIAALANRQAFEVSDEHWSADIEHSSRSWNESAARRS
jgi:hypothetical protein